MPQKDPEKRKEYQKRYRERNRERLLKEKIQWQKNNPEKKKQAQKRYYQKNKLIIRERTKKHISENPEKRRLACKKYYEKNKEKIKKYRREWDKKNQDHNKDYRRRNRKRNNIIRLKRIKEDKKYAVSERLRVLVRECLSRYTKTGKIMTAKKYGIYYKAIVEHLKPFPEDISKYHIDHIKPLCSFNLEDPEEIKKAFAPENHRWLTIKENLSRPRKVNQIIE